MVPAPSSPADPGTGSGSRSPSTNRSSGAFVHHVSRALERFDALLPFALVPLVVSLLQFEKVQRTLTPTRGFSINLEFTFPTPVLDLWSFVDPPESTTIGPSGTGPGDGSPFGDSPGTTESASTETGLGVETGSSMEFPLDRLVEPLAGPVETTTIDAITVDTMGWIGLAIVAYAVVFAAVLAGYLGGIDRLLRGEPASVFECIVSYAPRFFLYHLLYFGAVLLFVFLFVVAPPLFVLGILFAFVAGYLFYATPFLLVVADVGVLEGFHRSAEHALEGGAYFWFALWHMAVAAVVSGILSLLVSIGGAGGFIVAIFVTAPVGLVLTAATVSFCQELVGCDRAEGVSGGPGTGDRDTTGDTSWS